MLQWTISHIFNQEHLKSFVINMPLLCYLGFHKGEIHGKDTPGYSWPLRALPGYKALNLRGTLDIWFWAKSEDCKIKWQGDK